MYDEAVAAGRVALSQGAWSVGAGPPSAPT